MTETMERVLAEAKAYGKWFSVSHHFMSPVRARHQTITALYRRGLLEYVQHDKYAANMCLVIGRYGQYRFKEQP